MFEEFPGVFGGYQDGGIAQGWTTHPGYRDWDCRFHFDGKPSFIGYFEIVGLMSLQAVQYVERIPDVQEAVGAVLLSLGDGNWRMGDGMPIAKSNLGPGDEQIIIEHFMCTSPRCLSASIPFSANVSFRRCCEHCLRLPNQHLQVTKETLLRINLPSQQRRPPPYAHPPRTTQPEHHAPPLQTHPRRPQLKLPACQKRIFQ